MSIREKTFQYRDVIASRKETLYGPDTTTRPDADKVEAGTKFVTVHDTFKVHMSDGANWIDVTTHVNV